MHLLPMRRKELTAQSVGDEVILYDERIHKAFCLNRMAAALWHQLDGATPVLVAAARAGQAAGIPVEAETALLTVTEFERQGLLEEHASAASESMPLLVSRRRMIGGMGAGAALLVPAIAAVMTPQPAQAYCILGLNGKCILPTKEKAERRAATAEDGGATEP